METMISELIELGYNRWEEKQLENKEEQEVPHSILYRIRKWLLEDKKIYIEVRMNKDRKFIWIYKSIDTDETLVSDTEFESPEESLKNGIKTIWKLQKIC